MRSQAAYFLDHAAHRFAQAFDGLGGEADAHHLFRDFLLQLEIGLVLRALLEQRVVRLGVVQLDDGKPFQPFFLELEQGSGSGGAFGGFAVFVFIALDFGFFVFRQFLDHLVGVVVDQAVDQFVDAHLVTGDLVGATDDLGNRCRAGGDGLDHVLEAVFDTLGDFDFAFAREQFDRAHFTHVHAYRVGGAAEFGVDGGQRLFGLLFDVGVVGGHRRRRCRT